MSRLRADQRRRLRLAERIVREWEPGWAWDLGDHLPGLLTLTRVLRSQIAQAKKRLYNREWNRASQKLRSAHRYAAQFESHQLRLHKELQKPSGEPPRVGPIWYDLEILAKSNYGLSTADGAAAFTLLLPARKLKHPRGWDYELGPFVVNFFLDPGNYRTRISVRESAKLVDGYCHPHVFSDGILCAGEFQGSLSAALQELRLLDAVELIDSLLASYDKTSAYVQLERWKQQDQERAGGPARRHNDDGDESDSDEEDPEYIRCRQCESLLDPEMVGSCHGCGHEVCDDCHYSCRDCGNRLCSDCEAHCEACRESYCGNHAGQLIVLPDPSFEHGNLYCPHCRSECGRCGRGYVLRGRERPVDDLCDACRALGEEDPEEAPAVDDQAPPLFADTVGPTGLFRGGPPIRSWDTTDPNNLSTPTEVPREQATQVQEGQVGLERVDTSRPGFPPQ